MRRDEDFLSFETKARVILSGIFFAFLIILFRLWNLQVTHGADYKEISQNNRIRRIILPAPRGNIYDRNGTVVADTRPSYDLTVFLEDIKDVEHLASLLFPIIEGGTEEEIRRKIEKARADRTRLPYIPFIIKKDLSLEEIVRIEENIFDFPGVSISASPVRSYPFGPAISHLLGYIGRVSKNEYENLKDSGYLSWDIIGKAGVEKEFEGYLRGAHGGQQVQINNRNLLHSVLGKKDPVQGQDLFLTIDMDIQQKIAAAFGDHQGACVLMNVKNGVVLSYVSRPGFDSNLFATGGSGVSKLFVDETHPLVDRVIGGEYAPGSTFKPVVGLAALHENAIDERSSVLCTGAFSFAGIRFKCWKKYGHGEVDLNSAIEQSCNVFFYNLGREIGWKPIYETGLLFGFGQTTGITLPGEKAGILPSEEWKKKELGEPWYKGENINYSIGQGYLLVTPIQQAVYIAAMANGGYILSPVLVKSIVTNSEGVKSLPESRCDKIDVNPSHLNLIKGGLYSVVNGKKGTGKRAGLAGMGISVAGKTGTAQAAEKGERINHSWFVCYAPFDDPVVACVVLVEYTDSGALYAAPIAHEALLSYFEKYPYLKREEVIDQSGAPGADANPAPPSGTQESSPGAETEPVEGIEQGPVQRT